ncbi:hypothetical protein Agub_g11723 [Astrephomene gubernaculifera]|uniref:Rieske domain-containing protein n=1 Tax=Astrephomene gubernaculifera TaxID=47775 RepID=A0AAD3DXC2_9CHLO|nr:hypothetical protein Agub_g11723 [Astrephomene gubernaculifera]
MAQSLRQLPCHQARPTATAAISLLQLRRSGALSRCAVVPALGVLRDRYLHRHKGATKPLGAAQEDAPRHGSRNDNASEAKLRQVPEGMLSREEDIEDANPSTGDFSAIGASASETRTSAATQPHCVPDCILAREEEDDGPHDGPYPPDLRVLPGGMLSREEEEEEVAGSGFQAGQQAGAEANGPGSASPPQRPVVAAANVAATLLSDTATAGTSVATGDDAAATKPSSSPRAAPAPAAAPPAQFNWFQQWYPVAPLASLDPSRPHPFTLLGQELVLWRDGTGRWRAFQDACPHRLAPLSEGRVEADGSLLCAYHGWRFDGSGACTAIPSCRDADALRRATGNPRSCAVAYPTLERGGLLWVWGEGGPAAAAASAAKQPALPPELNEDGSGAPGVRAPGWTFRDLPYGHVYFIENVVDPAHVPVSHHKVAGDRYNDVKPFDMELSRPVTLEGGFQVRYADSWRKDVREALTGFTPPGCIRIEQRHFSGGTTLLVLYSTPTRPGWTRHMGQQLLVEAPGGARGSGISFFGAPIPSWLLHTLAAVFLHQDMVFLHHQERTVARQQQQRAAAAAAETARAGGSTAAVGNISGLPPPKYYMPTSVDSGVVAWRQWLSTYGGGDVSYAPGTPPLSPRESDPAKLFDTWNTHTRQCAICMRALQRIRALRLVAALAGGLAVVLATAAAAARAAAVAAAAAAAAGEASGSLFAAVVRGFLCREVLVAGAVAAVAALVWWVAGKLERMMHVYEYSHADNN